MQGKTVVITGATSGIGEIAAIDLAAKGARIVFVARDRKRGEATLAKLNAKAPGLSHKVHYADLSLLAEQKRVAAEIAAAEPRVDVLINNAGAAFAQRQLTADGFELTFALNHLSYFVITAGLRERLLGSTPARIVSTSSDAHRGMKVDLDDLQTAKSYTSIKAYGRSKLENILFTRELARRLRGTGVTANCLHPGVVATRFGHSSGGVIQPLLKAVQIFAISPEKGAETIVYLASSPEVANVSGEYFYKNKIAKTSPTASDTALAAGLWKKTVELTGVDWPEPAALRAAS
ncbi:short-chain dehydrogenase [Methylovirgula ligni]|uniref:NAD(P)-dependent dehydrogenase (Short-subunit alcohol dehydrogenase family) n=1 Tax=Methylovirgula ligni TaxID=569860 RepID=A0A3D9YVF1_9HYPH|nr:SDR family oxidoreductase [Methylovirgula ligni]QAY97286.1 short-chain dehydrogenase [Methylovirgula ligni]REF86505.1 NAD(P)-dependent dehydrogenase (short-subunit alcohol dehydrogenase family) [Methylovirgula ligni]